MSISRFQVTVSSLVLILLIFATPPHAVAEQHALLIGIGAYSVQPLEGPPNDAMSMQDVLTSRYGFKQENVVTLLEKDATRVRILGELERLVNRTGAGDKVLIFFSGHGTSGHDIKGMSLPLPHDTGALVPVDFRQGSGDSLDAIMSKLIIGKRDLRPPRLRKLTTLAKMA